METYRYTRQPAKRFERCLGDREEVVRAIFRVNGDTVRKTASADPLAVLPADICDPSAEPAFTGPVMNRSP